MAKKITDPLSFLTNLLTNKGKSDLYGIYLTGVNVLADCETDYGYDVSQSLASSEVFQLLSSESVEFLTCSQPELLSIIWRVLFTS